MVRDDNERGFRIPSGDSDDQDGEDTGLGEERRRTQREGRHDRLAPRRPTRTYGYGGFREDLLYEEDWRIEGPCTGRGPKGYQRSDEVIEEEANARLTYHGGLDASNITVSVENGEITLEGTVDSRRSKRMAEDALETIAGVKDIHNRLRVQQDQASPGA